MDAGISHSLAVQISLAKDPPVFPRCPEFARSRLNVLATQSSQPPKRATQNYTKISHLYILITLPPLKAADLNLCLESPLGRPAQVRTLSNATSFLASDSFWPVPYSTKGFLIGLTPAQPLLGPHSHYSDSSNCSPALSVVLSPIPRSSRLLANYALLMSTVLCKVC